MPFIQLSQSAPRPPSIRLNVVNQRRWRRRTVCGSDTVGASQWRAAARERRYSSPRSLGKELGYSDQDEACGGTKRLSWKEGNASVAEWQSTSASIRETFPALVDHCQIPASDAYSHLYIPVFYG